MSLLTRLRALTGVTLAQLRHERMRTVLAVLGVAMAVLAAVLLVSVGLGVVETGQAKFDQSGRDLWITGGPIELQPGTVGGFEGSLVGAHSVAEEISERDTVATAVPMGFQTVYAGRNTSQFETIVAAGAPARGPSVRITAGRPFQSRDVHYANGSYDGPMTHEAVIDQRTADLLGVGVNDSIHVGGTLATARQQEFTVVGVSPTYSRFIGSPTVTLHLSELQQIVGTTTSDRATFITVDVRDGENVSAVKAALEETYPSYTVRTNREQLRAIAEEQTLVIVSGASLALLAVVAGILLLVNLQLSYIVRHKRGFAALRAIGTSSGSLLTLVSVHTLTIGIVGGIVGIALTVPSVWLLNAIAASLTGFQNVVTLSPRVLGAGFSVAVCVSLLGGLLASLYLSRIRPLAVLS
ncbi:MULTISPECIES: ABC transporter permease [Salinibaculum]|uniref:ABC transporter permease n=1 Tax=Salinibaculum TaxID=2732368 RepID=UPI0030CF076F